MPRRKPIKLAARDRQVNDAGGYVERKMAMSF